MLNDNTSDQWNKDIWLQQFEAFTHLMKEQMLRNQHKGMREVWTAQSLEQQMIVLQMSLAELRTAIAYGIDVPDKAADVANWAFIIQDNFHNNPELIGLPANKRFND